MSESLTGKPEAMNKMREEGNQQFVKGDIKRAIAYYRQALRLTDQY